SAAVSGASAASMGRASVNFCIDGGHFTLSPLAGRGKRRRYQLLPRPPDALIGEAVAGGLLRPVDVAQVDQHWPLHRRLQPREVERAELLPLGDDDERGR